MSRAVLVGAGPIGLAAAIGARDEGVVQQIVGVVDPDEAARGVGAEQLDCPPYSSVDDLPEAVEGDWAIVAFGSRAEVVAPAIIRLVSLGYHVVTTCEELSRPDMHILQAIRSSAESDGRKVIATGANPGFVMDRLALAVAGGVRSISRIEITRRVNTAQRRGSLVTKTGRGLSTEEFRERAAVGNVGHAGLAASAKLLARGLLWPTHDVAETIEPVIDSAGTVSGVHQYAALQTPEGATLLLDLTMAWELDEPSDTIVVQGWPPVRVHIPGGYHGDLGTTAQVVNAIGRFTKLGPGFYRSIDLPLRFS